MARNLWTRNEMILTLALYFQLPFGRLNHSTPEVMELAKLIGRTNNAVALRLVNFAACDPYIINSGRTGMPGGLNICMPYWEEFANKKDAFFLEAEKIKADLAKLSLEDSLHIKETELVGKDKLAVVKQRVNHTDRYGIDVFKFLSYT